MKGKYSVSMEEALAVTLNVVVPYITDDFWEPVPPEPEETEE